MGTYYLKRGDVGPTMEVQLLDPDENAHDLSTGSPEVKLHIWLSDGTKLSARDMTISDAANGKVQYKWQSSDWAAGELVASPTPPFSPGQRDHRMEYEVLRAGAPERLTFPNGGPQGAADAYDTLHIQDDIGEGSL